jgi:hypothetical protein
MNMFSYTKLFILLIDKNKLKLNGPLSTMTFDLWVNRPIYSNQNFPIKCILTDNYSPNYDVKCLIGMTFLGSVSFKPFSLFDLNPTGITNYRQEGPAGKYYTTLCWRVIKCPTEFPFYNKTAKTCDNCLLYHILNGTLPQLCE